MDNRRRLHPSSEEGGTTLEHIQRAAAIDLGLPLSMLGDFNTDLTRMSEANQPQ
jgi:hypothetical protein